MTNPEYHATAGWSCSQLKLLPESPELFAGRYITKQYPQPETDVMDLGTAVHSELLGGDGWMEVPQDALTSNGQRRGKAWDAFVCEHPGQLLLLPSVASKVRTIADSVRADPMAKRLLDAPGETEESIFWLDPETGLELKARPDKQAAFPDGLIIADLKVVSDPTETPFAWKCYDYGYHKQAAWYTDAVTTAKLQPVEAFVFIAVRSEPPYECRVWELTERAIDRGRELNRIAIADLARRLIDNDWRGNGFGRCLPLDLPNRAYQQQ